MARKQAVAKRRGMGRPPVYTDRKAIAICRWISRGKSLRFAARAVKVTCETVRKWLLERHDFVVRYALAREAQADHFADEILEIADAAVRLTTTEEIMAARLRVDTRKWVAAHLRPKKWGDYTGGDQRAPVAVAIQVVIAREEWNDIIRSSREDGQLSWAATDPVGQ